jgi:hypothetical protein
MQERYAYREHMTDVIIQHLITEQKVRQSSYPAHPLYPTSQCERQQETGRTYRSNRT